MVPTNLIIVFASLFGLIVGSFLNVVIYRLHTGKSLEGRSRCLSCGHTLSWAVLFPVLSYLYLRGRCAYCSARISPRYLLVELLTAALFGCMAWFTQDPVLLLLYCALMTTFVLIIVYDVLHTIIPDEFVVICSVIAGGIVALQFVEHGDVHTVLLQLLGAAIGFLFFASLWLLSQGRWVGLGDAKLALPLGFLVGFPYATSVIVLSFWVGAGVSVLLLGIQRVVQRGQKHLPFLQTSLTIKSEVPFAPFLLIGFSLVYFFDINAFTLIADLLYSL